MPNEFNLEKNEKIIWEVKPLPSFKKYKFLRLAIIGFFALSIVCFFILPLTVTSRFDFITLIFIVILADLGIALIGAWTDYSRTYYMITNKRVLCKQPWTGRTSIGPITKAYNYRDPIKQISEIRITKGTLENLCGFSSLKIKFITGKEIIFQAVENPEKVKKLIERLQ